MRNYKRIKGNKIETAINAILARHDRFKSSYFWSPPGHASSRRQMENRESTSLSFSLDGTVYDIVQSVTCSCKNVYYSLSIAVDGISKNVRALKKLVA